MSFIINPYRFVTAEPTPVWYADYENDDYFDGSSAVFGDMHTASRATSGANIASTGYLVYSGVDVVRFQHEPDTGTRIGLLAETYSTRRNRIQASQALQSATFWARNNLTTPASDSIGPDNVTNSAIKMRSSTAGGTGECHLKHTGNFVVVDGAVIRVSVYAKADQTSKMMIRIGAISSPAAGNTKFDLSAGTVISADTGYTGYIEPAPNGYYRCITEFTPSGDTAITAYFYLLDSSASLTINRDGLSSVLLYGAQAMSSDTIYQDGSLFKTFGSVADRSPDVIATTGLAGTYDVRVTYGDDTTEDFLSEVIIEGWWPTLAKTLVKRIDVYTAGDLA